MVLTGCSIRELWVHLSCRREEGREGERGQPPSPFKLDESTKSFIWHQLKGAPLRNGSVQIFHLPTPRVAASPVEELEGLYDLKWQEYKHPFPYRYPVSWCVCVQFMNT